MNAGFSQHSISEWYVLVILPCGCPSSTAAECYFCILQALEGGKLELSTAFLVIQEMIAHWPQIGTYNSNTSQRQEFQHVEGRVSIFCN